MRSLKNQKEGTYTAASTEAKDTQKDEEQDCAAAREKKKLELQRVLQSMNERGAGDFVPRWLDDAFKYRVGSVLRLAPPDPITHRVKFDYVGHIQDLIGLTKEDFTENFLTKERDETCIFDMSEKARDVNAKVVTYESKSSASLIFVVSGGTKHSLSEEGLVTLRKKIPVVKKQRIAAKGWYMIKGSLEADSWAYIYTSETKEAFELKLPLSEVGEAFPVASASVNNIDIITALKSKYLENSKCGTGIAAVCLQELTEDFLADHSEPSFNNDGGYGDGGGGAGGSRGGGDNNSGHGGGGSRGGGDNSDHGGGDNSDHGGGGDNSDHGGGGVGGAGSGLVADQLQNLRLDDSVVPTSDKSSTIVKKIVDIYIDAYPPILDKLVDIYMTAYPPIVDKLVDVYIAWDERNKVLTAVKKGHMTLQLAPDYARASKEVVLEAVKLNGLALDYASKGLRADIEVVRCAIQQNGMALQFVSDKFKAVEDFALAAIKQNCMAFQFVSVKLKADKAFALRAVQESGMALQFVSEEFKADKEVALVAIKQNGKAVRFISEKLKADLDLALAVME